MNDEHVNDLACDEAFCEWLHGREQAAHESMDDDGFPLDFEEDDDGRFEQYRARWGHD